MKKLTKIRVALAVISTLFNHADAGSSVTALTNAPQYICLAVNYDTTIGNSPEAAQKAARKQVKGLQKAATYCCKKHGVCGPDGKPMEVNPTYQPSPARIPADVQPPSYGGFASDAPRLAGGQNRCIPVLITTLPVGLDPMAVGVTYGKHGPIVVSVKKAGSTTMAHELGHYTGLPDNNDAAGDLMHQGEPFRQPSKCWCEQVQEQSK